MDRVSDQRVNKKATARDPSLTDLVSLESLSTLQRRFAELGRVTVAICDTDGSPITPPTWGSRFSELIATSPVGKNAFSECLHRFVTQTETSAIIECHEGLTLYRVPIVHDVRTLAVIVVGSRSSAPTHRDSLQAAAKQYKLDIDELWDSASHIDPYRGGSPEAIRRFTEVLADTIATLYRQAHRIERQLDDLRTVHSFTELLTGTLDLQEILDRTAQRVSQVMHAKAASIRLLNRDTDELILKAVHNLSQEYLKKGPVYLHENVIDAAAFSGKAVHILDAATDSRIRYPENAKREGIVSGLCVPMTYRGDTIGVLRVYTGHRRDFSEAEESLLRSIGAQAAAAIITSRLWRDQTDAEKFQRQVNTAAEIQQRMLPKQPPQNSHLDFGTVYDPSLLLGGDFYDFLDYDDGRIGVCVADVVGKGLPAALMMASIRSALRANASRYDDVRKVMGAVNRHMCNDTIVSEFATVLFGVFDPHAKTLTYCNAGHPAPWLFRGEKIIELTAGGLVIGVMPDESYESETLQLQPGDVITMVTDGVTEAMNFEGVAYGFDRLRESILRYIDLDAQHLAKQILWDVRRFAGLAEQSDDITIVVIKVQ